MENVLPIKPKFNNPAYDIVGPFSQVSNFYERDKTQSRRLHEPTSISSHTDPITGNDVMAGEDHPFVKDGIMTVYFESEKTRQRYLNTKTNHPVRRLKNTVTAEDDRGG